MASPTVTTNPTSSALKWVPKNSNLLVTLFVVASTVAAATQGYDGSMMNSLNILPSYTEYFTLTTATTALNTCAMYIGGTLSAIVSGPLLDKFGRKRPLWWGTWFSVLAIILQTAAQNVGMFVAARALLGIGTGIQGNAAAVYLAEVSPYNIREWTVGILSDFYYVGSLLAAGITYGTAKMDSTWAWRAPSAVQGLFAVTALMILPFIPESPRWLIYQDRFEEAHEIVALIHSNGDGSNAVSEAQYKEILDAIAFEKTQGVKTSYIETMRSQGSRFRMLLMFSVEVCSVFSGNSIISYYLGTMLDNAGITDTTTQLEINIYLNLWCLVIALIGTWIAGKISRKMLACIATFSCMIFIYMIGVMTKLYGTSSYSPGVYGTVAFIFLFQGAYSFGWTPLTYLYPAEVLNYSIRSSGMAASVFSYNGLSFITTFAYPFAVDALGWKVYMLNGTWDVFELAFVAYYWVETRGKTLEEIDALFDGVKHSSVPDLEDISTGKVIYANSESSNSVDGVVIKKEADSKR